MNFNVKKGVLFAGIAVSVIVGIVAFASTYNNEEINLDMTRTHGTISTAMGSSIVGNPDAKITLVEFGDYQCHFCKKWFDETKPNIIKNYIDAGKVNFVFVDFAFLGKDSPKAAQAAYCAEDQGKYWDYHDVLYRSQESQIDGGWANTERLKAFAFSLNLDMDLFDTCLDSGKYSKRVQYNTNEGKKQGINSTPGFFIVGPDGQQQKISGAQPYSVFKQVIDSMI